MDTEKVLEQALNLQIECSDSVENILQAGGDVDANKLQYINKTTKIRLDDIVRPYTTQQESTINSDGVDNIVLHKLPSEKPLIAEDKVDQDKN